MGFIKVITKADADYDYLVNCYNYVVAGHTVHCGAVNVRPSTALEQFTAVRRYFGKVTGNQLVHYVIVLDTRFHNLDTVIKAGYRIANFYSNEYQLLFGVHEQCMQNKRGKDRSYYHIHMIMNPVSFVNGKMFASTWNDINQFVEHIKQATGDSHWKVAFGSNQSINELID